MKHSIQMKLVQSVGVLVSDIEQACRVGAILQLVWEIKKKKKLEYVRSYLNGKSSECKTEEIFKN